MSPFTSLTFFDLFLVHWSKSKVRNIISKDRETEIDPRTPGIIYWSASWQPQEPYLVVEWLSIFAPQDTCQLLPSVSFYAIWPDLTSKKGT